MSYEAKIEGNSVKIYKNRQLVSTKGGMGVDAVQVLVEGEYVICLKKNGMAYVDKIQGSHSATMGSVKSAQDWIKKQG